MSHSLILELFRRVDARDWESLSDAFAEDAVYERPGYEPLRGRDEVMHFYREVRVIASGDHHLDQIVSEGQSAACAGRFVGVHRNGSPIDERFADLYTFDDQGRIKTRRSFFFRPAV